jgi:hypothetical protein
MLVEVQLVVVARVPLNITVPEDPKLVPVIVSAVPTVPDVGLRLIITGAGTETVSVRVAEPVPAVFVALSVTVDVPAPVGVPEIIPVDVFTDSPAGNPVALKLVGEFVAVI